MITGVRHVSVLVEDYDEALRWYTEKLGLEPRLDGSMAQGYRFVTVGVTGQDVEIVLHKPFGDTRVRDLIQANMNVQHGLVFGSDHCRKDTEELRRRGVNITQGPEDVPWGVQTVFQDLYGNSHVLVESPAGPAE